MQVPSILSGESRTSSPTGNSCRRRRVGCHRIFWGGWMTGSSANKLAAERADTAVVAALTPICVEKFLQNSDAKANLAVLQKISTSWEQGDYLQKGGWVISRGQPPPTTTWPGRAQRSCSTPNLQPNEPLKRSNSTAAPGASRLAVSLRAMLSRATANRRRRAGGQKARREAC